MQNKMEQQFESLINSVEAIIWEADFKTSAINYVSQFVYDLLGYSVERWLDDPGLFMQIVHPDDLPSVEKAKHSVTPENNRYEVVYRVFKANGEQVWLCDRVSVVFVEGEPKLLRGISTDVSERHRIEEALALVVEATLAASELQGVTDIAQATLSRICQVLGLSFGQVWFMDASSAALVCSPHVSFSTGEFSSLRQASLAKGFSVENPRGLPALAASAANAVFIEDLSQEQRLLHAHGANLLKSGFAFPVKNGDEILCVFEFFAPYVLRPERYFHNAIEEISAHLSVVFERRIAQELFNHTERA
jgi:PAS domain S-box